MPRMRSKTSCFAIAFALCFGCASAQTATPNVEHPSSAPPAHAVPADPLELVVAGPDSVAVLQVDQLRSSPLFGRLRPYLERATCTPSEEWQSLAQATTRAVVASRPAKDGDQWLLAMSGQYSDADAKRLLGEAVQRRDGAAAPPAAPAQTLGRFQVSEQADLASSVLEQRILLLGAKDWVRAAIAAVDAPSPSFAVSPIFRELGSNVHCGDRTACLFAAANGSAAKRMQHSLLGIGAADLGRAFSESDSALALAVPSALELSFAVHLSSAEIAQAAAKQIKDYLWQASLVTRLAGLPSVLDQAQLRADDALLHADLNVSEQDLAAYEARAGRLFEEAAPSCDQPQNAAPP
jgi:hypothetical protein